MTKRQWFSEVQSSVLCDLNRSRWFAWLKDFTVLKFSERWLSLPRASSCWHTRRGHIKLPERGYLGQTCTASLGRAEHIIWTFKIILGWARVCLLLFFFSFCFLQWTPEKRAHCFRVWTPPPAHWLGETVLSIICFSWPPNPLEATALKKKKRTPNILSVCNSGGNFTRLSEKQTSSCQKSSVTLMTEKHSPEFRCSDIPGPGSPGC